MRLHLLVAIFSSVVFVACDDLTASNAPSDLVGNWGTASSYTQSEVYEDRLEVHQTSTSLKANFLVDGTLQLSWTFLDSNTTGQSVVGWQGSSHAFWRVSQDTLFTTYGADSVQMTKDNRLDTLHADTARFAIVGGNLWIESFGATGDDTLMLTRR